MKTMNKNHWIAVVVAIVVVGFFAFGGSLFNVYRSAQPQSTTFNNQTGSTINMPEPGFIVQDLVEGSGEEAKAGDRVRVHYVGALPSGEVFDSSLVREEPFEFIIGAGMVIEGWDKGIAGMKIGSRRRLVIPPELGYGSQPIGPIPANSTLIFEVELIQIVR